MPSLRDRLGRALPDWTAHVTSSVRSFTGPVPGTSTTTSPWVRKRMMPETTVTGSRESSASTHSRFSPAEMPEPPVPCCSSMGRPRFTPNSRATWV